MWPSAARAWAFMKSDSFPSSLITRILYHLMSFQTTTTSPLLKGKFSTFSKHNIFIFPPLIFHSKSELDRNLSHNTIMVQMYKTRINATNLPLLHLKHRWHRTHLTTRESGSAVVWLYYPSDGDRCHIVSTFFRWGTPPGPRWLLIKNKTNNLTNALCVPPDTMLVW